MSLSESNTNDESTELYACLPDIIIGNLKDRLSKNHFMYVIQLRNFPHMEMVNVT